MFPIYDSEKSTLKKQLNFLYRLNKILHQDSNESIRLNFNILGHHYEIPVSILNNYPDTLLGEPKWRIRYYDYVKNEFIFDRHPQAFESILTFYLSDGNSLSKPEYMPADIFYEELKFFRMKPSLLISFYDQNIASMIDIEIVPRNPWRRSIWLLLNYQTHNWKSQLMCTIDFLLNLLTLWTFTRDCLSDHQISQIIYWIEESNRQVLRPIFKLFNFHITNILIEFICTIIFLIQLIVRIYSRPTLKQIYSDISFWFECYSVLINILMYFIFVIERFTKISFDSCLTIISFLRVFRIFRFTRQIIGLKIFLHSIIYGFRELIYLFLILITIILFFGELIYLLEHKTIDSSIQTVTDGYWLTALTVTSLGYGDTYPTHTSSRLLMSICSIIGLILIAMPIPEIYHYFNRMLIITVRTKKKERSFDRMKSQPVTITMTNGTSTPAKRTLFRIALVVSLIGIVATSTILILHGGFALGRLRYFVDIGLHPLHLTSGLILLLGLLSLATFIIFTIGLTKMNKTFVTIAAILMGICSIALIAMSVWSFLTITSRELPASIKNSLLKELDETQYSGTIGNITITNTMKMARLERQHACCGLTNSTDDYRTRQPPIFESWSPSPSSGRKVSATQRNPVAFDTPVLLPISCCNENYRSAENLCVDMFANYTNPLNRYNTKGCYDAVIPFKYDRIQKQGFTTVVAACLAVLSCIALAAVIRLLGEGYQIAPLRATL